MKIIIIYNGVLSQTTVLQNYSLFQNVQIYSLKKILCGHVHYVAIRMPLSILT